MLGWKKNTTKELLEEIGKYTLRKQIDDVEQSITLLVEKQKEQCQKISTKALQEAYNELVNLQNAFYQEIRIIKNICSSKNVALLPEHFNKLRLIEESYDGKIKLKAKTIEREVEENQRKQKKEKITALIYIVIMQYIFFPIIMLGVGFYSFSMSFLILIHHTGKYSLDKLPEEFELASYIILSGVITIVLFAIVYPLGAINAYIERKTNSNLIAKLMLEPIIFFPMAFVLIALPHIIYGNMRETINNIVYLSILPSITKFIINAVKLDPVSLFLAILATLATIDALINLYNRTKKIFSKEHNNI